MVIDNMRGKVIVLRNAAYHGKPPVIAMVIHNMRGNVSFADASRLADRPMGHQIAHQGVQSDHLQNQLNDCPVAGVHFSFPRHSFEKNKGAILQCVN